MWKWPALAGVLLLFVLALGVLLFGARPVAPPRMPSNRPIAEPPAATEPPSPSASPSHPPTTPSEIAPAEPPTAIAQPEAAAPPATADDPNAPAPRASAPGSAEPGTEAPSTEHKIWGTDAAGIRGAVQESVPELKDCYEQWMQTNPHLKGKLKIGFTISNTLEADAGSVPEATVSQVSIDESEIGHVFMEGCVKNVFSGLRFTPPADGKLDVTYPLQFDYKDDEPGSQAP